MPPAPQSQDSAPSIPLEDRVPLRQKIAYAMGVVSDHYATVCLTIFLIPFFSDFLKVSATLVGLAMALARLWDAFTDPLVGVLTDRSKNRWGRRKPFIFVGVILTGLAFPLLWLPSAQWSEMTIFTYLCIALFVYYSFYSLLSIPYESLGSELTSSYIERTNIYVVRSYVQQTFNLGIMWIFPLAVWLATFPSIGTEINGVRVASLIIGLVIILAGINPALFCVERYRDIAARQREHSFVKDAKAMLRNRPLLIVVGTIATYLLAIMSTVQLSYFVNVYYIYEGNIRSGVTLGGIDGTLRFCFSLLGAFMIKKMSDRFDKHHLLMACVCILIVAFIGMYFTHIPGRPYLTLSMKPLLALGEVGFWILVISMRADVCDYHEYRTGRRSEGTVSAAANWVIKVTVSVAILMGGVILEHFVKFDSNLSNAAAQAPGTMDRLLLSYTVPPVIALVVCLGVLYKYPLTQKRMQEIRSTLETARGRAVGG